jgi:hypothetical protein
MAFCFGQSIPYPTFHYWCKRVEMVHSAGFMEVGIDEVACIQAECNRTQQDGENRVKG